MTKNPSKVLKVIANIIEGFNVWIYDNSTTLEIA